jgi:uncharacterized protein DUF2167
LSFGGETEHTLNYDIRALGRRGVLSLNAVASMDQLQAVEKDMKQVLSFVEFNDGHRYNDYVAGADKVAGLNCSWYFWQRLEIDSGCHPSDRCLHQETDFRKAKRRNRLTWHN